MEEKLFLWINRDDEVFIGSGPLQPVLERVANLSLPQPTILASSGKGGRRIGGYLDPAVRKALDTKKTVKLSNPDVGLDFVVWQVPDRTAISLFIPVPHAPAADELRRLFRDLIEIVSPTYATLYPSQAGRVLNDAVYQFHRRTFYASGLYWLNFFGAVEEERQGGSALGDNPYARAERLPQGLLLEIGEGPLDIMTPEGRQRLIQATAAMPQMDTSAPKG